MSADRHFGASKAHPLLAFLLLVCACAPPDAPRADDAPSAPTSATTSPVTEADIPSDVRRDSWARLPLPRREAIDTDGQRAFDLIVSPDSRYSTGLRGPAAMWVYSPLMAEHLFPFSTYLRYETAKDQRLTELAILTTAREARSQYEWTSHEPLALQAGLEPAIIDLVRHRSDLGTAGSVPGLGERERTIIAFAREAMSSEKVSAETFRAALDLFGERGVMDLAGLVGYYAFVDITLKSFDVQLAPGRERLLPDLW
jgi:4-carboxymuconolactone decarboxylase